MRTLGLVSLVALNLALGGCGGDDVAPTDVPGGGGAASGASGQGGAGGGPAGGAGKSGGSGAGGAAAGGGGAAGAGGASTGGAGAGGTGAGSAGGKGGAAGTGGNSGGTAGTSGTGGAGSSGKGGNGGNSGNSGNAGQSGGAGGTSGSGGAGTGGVGGAGGSSGAAGNAGAGGVLGPPDDLAAVLAKLAIPCNDALATFYDAVPLPSPWTSAQRGTIVRCAYDKLVSTTEIAAELAANGLASVTVETALHKFRLVYLTERGSGVPVATSGAFYYPEMRKANPSPLVVFGHGIVGAADVCAPSRELPTSPTDNWRPVVYGIGGKGWPVVQPDYPGLGLPGPQVQNLAVDEGHSILDATRAARKLLKPGVLGAKNGLVGHSGGGHAVLAAQAQSASYGTSGTIDATVVFAPFWISNGAWGAAINPFADGLVTPFLVAQAAQYFYGHLAAYEGEASALDAFLPAKAAAARDLLETKCVNELVKAATGFPSIGVTKGSDLFVPSTLARSDSADCSTRARAPSRRLGALAGRLTGPRSTRPCPSPCGRGGWTRW